MAIPVKRDRPLEVEEILAWDSGDDLRYELVDGWPVPVLGQSQPAPAHGAVAGAMIALLFNHFARSGRPCRVETPTAVRIQAKARRVRGPDVVVRCGATAREADDPIVVIEVLSPENTVRQMEEKEDDYRSVPSIQCVVRLAQDAFFATTLRRAGDLWVKDAVSGPDAVLRIEAIAFEAPLRDIYRTVLDADAVANEAAQGA